MRKVWIVTFSLTAGCRSPQREVPSTPSEASVGIDPSMVQEVEPPVADRPVFSVDGNVFRYNGRLLRMLDRLETWEAVLGPPSRVRRENSVISDIWDDLGLLVAAKPTPDGRAYVRLAALELVKTKKKDWEELPSTGSSSELPRAAFPGTVVLEGVRLNKGWNDVAEVLREVRGVRVWPHCVESFSTGFRAFGPDGPVLDVGIEEKLVPGGGKCDRRFDELEFDLRSDWWW
jgi:hypothetical protein